MYKMLAWVLVPVALFLAWLGWDLFETAEELITPEMRERSAELWGKVREDGDWTGTAEEWEELWRLDDLHTERWRTQEAGRGAISGAILAAFSSWLLWAKSKAKS